MFRDGLAQMRRAVAVVGVIAAAVVASSAHYIVIPGDTLSGIAQRQRVPIAELVALNRISNPDLIVAGTRLVLPTGSASTPAAHTAAVHVVARGETVASIAAAHGISTEQLEAANGSLGGRIYAGTTLRLEGSRFVADSGGYTVHRIDADDALEHIASHHGTSAHDLAHANGLDERAVVAAGSQLKIPVPWQCPVRGARYFNDWGFPRPGGRTHTGTDLFAARGTPILAPVSGVIEQVTGSVGGYQFILQGDDGTTYLGSHMDGFAAGGRVEAGAVIGYVGDSGNARGTDPHLHFQIHPRGGDPTNPYPSLVANQC